MKSAAYNLPLAASLQSNHYDNCRYTVATKLTGCDLRNWYTFISVLNMNQTS